ncbi:MAG: hypothetical protein MJZ61_10315 [Bacteroidales bacterium]|nr:hypothetical protein [Bacteroidales bacterium]
MLGSDFNHIYGKFNDDPEYYIKVDTINRGTLVITCKGSENYPYYTYEIDIENNECVSFGTVSKDRQVYDAYVDMLTTVGKLVQSDHNSNNNTYEVISHGGEKIYYSIKQPFLSSDMLSRRSIFYVLVTRDKR